jgi:FkbM family methyltransferase
MKRAAKALLRRLDRDLVRRSTSYPASRARILELAAIDVVLDVGANVGQYAQSLREWGFRGRIVSFEPQTEQFRELAALAARDGNWDCLRLALGPDDGEAELTITGRSEMSSLLHVRKHVAAASDDWRPVATEVVPTRRLDSIADDVLNEGERTFLKLDVQGYELGALGGAPETLRRVEGVETELSLAPLYEGQSYYHDVIDLIESAGFELAALKPGHFHFPSGRLGDLDVIFMRGAG